MIILGATRGPLDASFTIPGIGIVITVRGLLQTLCAAANLDKTTCNLINQSPEQACKTLVAKGDKWLHDRIEDAFDVMIAQVLEGIDCQKKNWKEIVVDSLDISFSNEGIAIEIDESAILQNVICALARKAIDLSLEAPINMAVRKLKEACTKLSATSSSTSTTTKPPTTTSTSTAAPFKLPTTVLADHIDAVTAAAIKPPVAVGEKFRAKPESNTAWLWWAGGLTVATGGFLWFFAKKRKS